MKKILLILFVFISTHAFSQFGVKGGVNYYHTSYSLYGTGLDLSIGLTAGVFVKMGSFVPEVNYWQMTFKGSGITASNNMLNFSANYQFDLGSVGLLAGLGWDYHLSTSASGGGEYYSVDGSSDLLMNLNVGAYYPISDALIVDVRFQKPVATNLFEGFTLDGGSYTTMLTVGYMFGN